MDIEEDGADCGVLVGHNNVQPQWKFNPKMQERSQEGI